MSYIAANTIALSQHRDAARDHEKSADAHDYQTLLRKKALGGNCDTCDLSVDGNDGKLRCSLKAGKTVNPLAVCQHFKE